MSNSAIDPDSRILLTDSYKTIVNRICGAGKDCIPGITFNPVERPGANNLLTILSACTGEVLAVPRRTLRWEQLWGIERRCGEVVEEALRKPHTEFGRLREEKTSLAQVARDGAEKGREKTLKEVRKRVGLL